MAEGFRIAQAFVEIETEDNTMRGLGRILARVRSFGDQVSDRVRRSFGDGFTKAGSAVSGFVGMLQSAAQTGTNAAMQIGSSLAAAATSGTAMTAATGGLNILVGVLVALAGGAALAATGFTLLAPLLLLAGGAAGAAATGAIGLVGAFAVLKMGTSGVSDALAEFWENGEITAETLAKLSPNAQRFVQALTKLKAPLDAIKRSVQDALFKDMDTAFSRLAGQWLPALGPLLTQLSSQFNAVGKSILEALGKPDFISNIKRAISGFGQFMMYIGANIDELIGSIGKIAAAAAPFLIEIGRLIGAAMQKFSDWIARAEASGALTSFFQNAVQSLRDIWAIGGLVFGIVGQIIAILFPGSDRAADSIFGGIRTALEGIKGWLSDPANVEAIQGFIQTIQDKVAAVVAWFSDPANQEAIQLWIDRILTWVSTAAGWAVTVEGWIAKVKGWIETVKGWGVAIAAFIEEQKTKWEEFKTSVSEKVEAVRKFFSELPGKIMAAIFGLPAMVISLFSSMLNTVLFNVGFIIGSIVGFFAGLPGKVGSAISALPGVVSGIFNTVKTTASNLASSAVEAVRSFFSQTPGKVGSALSGVRSAVTGAFSGAAGWLTSAGANILAGLTSGIRGAIGAAVDAAKSAAQAVVNGVKAGLGINSPSTVMRDEVGRWIPPGIVQGVTAAMPAAVRDVRDEVQGLAQLPAFGHAEARAFDEGGDRRRPITISMAGANFYGVGSAREFVASLYEALDDYEGEHR